MTAAMFDRRTEREQQSGQDPTQLRRGTLVYLWRPGARPWHDGNQPVQARVQNANRNVILAVDLRDGAEGQYDIAADITQPGRMRWTWEVAVAPRTRTVSANSIERIDASALNIEERVKLICGDVGTPLLVRLKNGDAIRGALTRLIMAEADAWEAEWIVFTGDRDSAGNIAHVVRAEEIAGFSRDPDA